MPTHSTRPNPRKQAAIDLRVEWLGQMSDRRREASEADDLDALEQIAVEYEARKMANTAGEIRKAIAIRKKGVK